MPPGAPLKTLIIRKDSDEGRIPMDRQGALFTELERRPTEVEPRGFGYREEIVTEDEEAALVASLGQLDLKPFEFHGHRGNRRVASFGLRYDFSRRSVETASDVPAFLGDLLFRVAEFAGYQTDSFRQVGVNEYRPGAGIGWHKDKSQFGIIVGVSLLAPATMRFRRTQGANWMRISHTLKPRSIYILSEEARTEWEHSIPPLSELRYSITFRTLSDTFQA
jgi:alkylated DNA repair dioxygenase AlkB